ncbi:MAG: hypothetical protein ABSB28_09280 [Candidatus Bathyarchaeia archaeon]
MTEDKSRANEIVEFLKGTWVTRDVTVTPNHEVKVEEYREIMKIKDSETLSITALGVDKGQDVTRDMVIRLVGNKVVLSQRDFSAEGVKKGNFVSVRGTHDDLVYDFRLYLLDGKYVFQKDIWREGKIVEVQMSILLRRSK